MQTSTHKSKLWEKVKDIRYLPFEHPKVGTLVYTFLAGIFASLAAQLFMTSPLNPTPPICTATLVTSASLFAISSLAMILISFEIEAFKEDLPNEGSSLDKKTRRSILEKTGVVHEPGEEIHAHFNRIWKLWIYLGLSVTSAALAVVLIWTN
jgi:hypothetical protein